MLQSGDAFVIKSHDRLSRNKTDIKNELQYFKDNNIYLKVIELLTTIMERSEGQGRVFEMVNNILIEVLGTIAEQERETIRKRQREGIEAARARGKHLGRPRAIKPNNWDEVIDEWKSGRITARQAYTMLGVSKRIFYRWVRM